VAGCMSSAWSRAFGLARNERGCCTPVSEGHESAPATPQIG